MKKTMILMICLALFSVTIAQNRVDQPIPDPRIVAAYGQETVDHLMQTSPRTIEYYNFFLTDSYYIVEIPQEKIHEVTDTERFTLKNPGNGELPDFSAAGLETLNVLRFHINIHPLAGAMYRLGNTNKLIVFYPGNEITEKFKQHLNSK